MTAKAQHSDAEFIPGLPRRTFIWHTNGHPVIRALNVPGADVPEYQLPYGPADEAALTAALAYCFAVWGHDAGNEG